MVKIAAYAGFDPNEITEDDLDDDHMEAVSQLLRREEAEGGSSSDLDAPAFKGFRFDLCPDCHSPVPQGPAQPGHDEAAQFQRELKRVRRPDRPRSGRRLAPATSLSRDRRTAPMATVTETPPIRDVTRSSIDESRSSCAASPGRPIAACVDETGDDRRALMAFNRGVLEIMSPGLTARGRQKSGSVESSRS